MVNRVNGNDYYDYTKLKMPDAADKTGSGDQFSMAYQRAQEDADENNKKDMTDELGTAETSAETGRPRTVMQSGVKLELSGNAQSPNSAKEDIASKILPVGKGIVDTIRSWISAFVQAAKELLYKIWNDPVPQEDVTVQDKTVETDETERLSEEYLALKNLEELRRPETAAKRQIEREAEREKEIQKLLRSGDMGRVLSLVTENGQRTMAKNSTLLTYYDRSGRIAPLSASDQERILHGDRGTRKL